MRVRRVAAERRIEAVAVGEGSMAAGEEGHFEEKSRRRAKENSSTSGEGGEISEQAKGDVGRLFDISARKVNIEGRAPDRESLRA